jgi:hypothetical protein
LTKSLGHDGAIGGCGRTRIECDPSHTCHVRGSGGGPTHGAYDRRSAKKLPIARASVTVWARYCQTGVRHTLSISVNETRARRAGAASGHCLDFACVGKSSGGQPKAPSAGSSNAWRPDSKTVPPRAALGVVPDDRMVTMPSVRDLHQAANGLRQIVELTSGLSEESPKDLVLQDRLELAARVLEASAEPH